jgi:hypothetical protein
MRLMERLVAMCCATCTVPLCLSVHTFAALIVAKASGMHDAWEQTGCVYTQPALVSAHLYIYLTTRSHTLGGVIVYVCPLLGNGTLAKTNSANVACCSVCATNQT